VTAGAAAFLPAVRALCLEAGRAVMALRGGPLEKSHKPDHSLVTNADHAANDILRRGLRAAFPDHAVLSEETGFEGPSASPRVWLVDPLDGTRAYARGRAGFSVMVGLIEAGRPVAGVVYDPLEDRLYEAARGGGAFQTIGGRRAPLHVSRREALADMPVITSTGFPEEAKGILAGAFPGPWLAPINSVGVKVGWVARGDADIYLNHHNVHLWDTAGPQAILEEAGGVITLWDGSPLAYDFSRSTVHPGPTLATNGPRHAEASAALQATVKKLRRP
jgi:3'(2'), 5'-bisphosphate nucleotidase